MCYMHLKEKHILPPTFRFEIKKTGMLSYCLNTSQVLAVKRDKAFEFFQDPENLCDITPVWLDFCLLADKAISVVRENAEYDYTIRWLGIKVAWRSRVINYKPPERFTDIQIRGPYRAWVHTHILEEVPEGTLMKDEVLYTLYWPALLLHPFVIRRQLEDIFSFRAAKIAEWGKNIKNKHLK